MRLLGRMIRNKNDYKYYIDKDKKALGINGTLKDYFFHDIWAFQKALRMYELYTNGKFSIVGKLLLFFIKFRYRCLSKKLGFSIPPNVFGPGLSIAHPGTIVINRNTRVGANCRLHVCVNIGSHISNGNLAPRIGNDCYIGPGAKIFGNISLGNNIAIGANAVVNKSFGESLTIAGVPAKIISYKGTKSYRIKDK